MALTATWRSVKRSAWAVAAERESARTVMLVLVRVFMTSRLCTRGAAPCQAPSGRDQGRLLDPSVNGSPDVTAARQRPVHQPALPSGRLAPAAVTPLRRGPR